MTTCKNCNKEFEGKFCPNCSQKASTHRFTIRHFGYEFLHALTHTDKGILFLMKELATKPGLVAREYNEGKRKKYFNPMTFLLLMLALQIFVAQKSGIYDYFINQTQEFISRMQKASPDTDLTESLQKLEGAKVQQAKLLENQRIVTFVLLPVVALITWLFFYKSGQNYAETLVMGVMVQAELYLLFFILCLGLYLIMPATIFFTMYLYIALTWIYSFVAYRQFFKQSWGWTIAKGIVIQVVYIIIVGEISNLVVKYL